jgi:hypothetical protein
MTTGINARLSLLPTLNFSFTVILHIPALSLSLSLHLYWVILVRDTVHQYIDDWGMRAELQPSLGMHEWYSEFRTKLGNSNMLK